MYGCTLWPWLMLLTLSGWLCAVQAMWDDVAERMTELGFERGWGATAARIREQFRLLLDVLQVRQPGQW